MDAPLPYERRPRYSCVIAEVYHDHGVTHAAVSFRPFEPAGKRFLAQYRHRDTIEQRIFGSPEEAYEFLRIRGIRWMKRYPDTSAAWIEEHVLKGDDFCRTE